MLLLMPTVLPAGVLQHADSSQWAHPQAATPCDDALHQEQEHPQAALAGLLLPCH